MQFCDVLVYVQLSRLRHEVALHDCSAEVNEIAMAKIFVSEDFKVPKSLVTDLYRLEILEPNVAEIDYDAVMSSKERLRHVFCENDEWPADNMTLEDNMRDLEQHEAEFHSRKAFAYTVLTLSKERCIGCVYFYPSSIPEYDCEAYLWVRTSEVDLDDNLYINIRNWLKTHWQFKRVAFPGRKIPWKKWPGTLFQ